MWILENHILFNKYKKLILNSYEKYLSRHNIIKFTTYHERIKYFLKIYIQINDYLNYNNVEWEDT